MLDFTPNQIVTWILYKHSSYNTKSSQANPILAKLILAKTMSDIGDYDTKQKIMSQLMTERPNEFYVDSELNPKYLGLTHAPTKFRIHLPRNTVPIQVRLNSILNNQG